MKFLTQPQFTEMWKLQDSLNTATSGPDWKDKEQDWDLAIKDEIMEFHSYVGFKWWKTPDQTKQPTDMQARMELVDIWHFLLSKIIEEQEGWGPEDTAVFISNQAFENAEKSLFPLRDLDSRFFSLRERVFALHSVLLYCDWSWNELFRAYIGKVSLNAFRQLRGYKTGEYKKIWGGKEDNFWLEEIITKLSLREGALTYEAVSLNLEEYYQSFFGEQENELLRPS